MKILIDTNVIIDVLNKRKDFFDNSFNALQTVFEKHQRLQKFSSKGSYSRRIFTQILRENHLLLQQSFPYLSLLTLFLFLYL